MLSNYHTHTTRCNHATGTEREYVEAAIARGVQTLGFSDHSPQFFDGDHYSGFRMRREQFSDYVQTIRALREEYAGKIDIKIGLEMEYYPKHFDRLMDFVAPYQLDYLILGQHFIAGNEDDMPSGGATEEKDRLITYVDLLIAGMKTGVYTYLAHPDLLNYVGDEAFYRSQYTRLCQAAKEMDIPLEMNLLGFATKRHYPCTRFFYIAREVGNEVVLGCDAHSLEEMQDVQAEQDAIRWLKNLGITPVEVKKLRKPVL